MDIPGRREGGEVLRLINASRCGNFINILLRLFRLSFIIHGLKGSPTFCFIIIKKNMIRNNVRNFLVARCISSRCFYGYSIFSFHPKSLGNKGGIFQFRYFSTTLPHFSNKGVPGSSSADARYLVKSP